MFEYFFYGGSLRVADLEDEGGIGFQEAVELLCDFSVDIEAVGARGQGGGGFIVFYVFVERAILGGGYVGRVAEYEVEVRFVEFGDNGIEEVALEELDSALEVVCFYVFGGDGEGRIGDVGRDDGTVFKIFCDGYGDAS